jgi:hypothetical protein
MVLMPYDKNYYYHFGLMLGMFILLGHYYFCPNFSKTSVHGVDIFSEANVITIFLVFQSSKAINYKSCKI